jgi:hypothetical protein
MPTSNRRTSAQPAAKSVAERRPRVAPWREAPPPRRELAIEYAQGGGECWLHGEHLFTSPPPKREDWREVHGAPVVAVRPNGDREWRVEGKLHREEEPAVEYAEGGGEWWVHGVNHREDGPAAVFPDGSWAWYKNGRLHRLDGPALWEPGGRVAWYRSGLPHREDGPAIFDPRIGYGWALDGQLFFTEDEFNAALAKRPHRPKHSDRRPSES